jgi:hypothetical protein
MVLLLWLLLFILSTSLLPPLLGLFDAEKYMRHSLTPLTVFHLSPLSLV